MRSKKSFFSKTFKRHIISTTKNFVSNGINFIIFVNVFVTKSVASTPSFDTLLERSLIYQPYTRKNEFSHTRNHHLYVNLYRVSISKFPTLNIFFFLYKNRKSMFFIMKTDICKALGKVNFTITVE